MKPIRISTENAPKAIGPYSQAIEIGNMVFCSGQVPLIPSTMELEMADIKIQTRRVLQNLAAVLEAAGTSMKNVVKTTVFLTDFKNFEVFNKEYAAFFEEAGALNLPARSTIQISALPRASLIEIEAVAFKG